MKILNNKNWRYILDQVEIRDEIIRQLIEIANYYKEESEILLDMLEETREGMEAIGIKISNKDEYYETMGENKKLNNIMDMRLETLEKMVVKRGE